MPPSTAASGHSEEDDAEHAHRASNQSAEISDSDVDVRKAEGVEEEEIEVEEEIEEEYGDDDEAEEVEEAAAAAEQEIDSPEELEEKWNDVGQNMESKRTVQQWVSSSTPEISEPKPLYGSLLKASVCNFKTDTSNDSLTIHQEESHVSYDDARDHKSGKPLVAAGENKSLEPAVNEMDTEAILNKDPKEFSQAHGDSKDYLHDTEGSVAGNINPSIIMGKELTTASVMRECSILDSKNKVEPMNLQAEDKRKQIASRFSRLVASNVRTRSLSPSVEFKNGSKRPAVLCEFFAKGWCIKGISCSFLHLNDKAYNTSQQNERDIAAAYLTTEENLEGLRNNMGKSKLPGYPEPITFSESILPLQHVERQRLNQLDEKHKFLLSQGEDLSSGFSPASQQLSSSKCDPGFSSFKDVGNHMAPTNSGGSAVTSINYCSINPSSHSSSLVVLTGIGSQYMNGLSLDASLVSSGTLPSYRMSASLGSSFSFSPTLNNFQKVSDSDIDHHISRSSSSLQCASFCGSEPQRLPQPSRSLDLLHYAEHKEKFLPDDWEPSVPFQPSFFITPTMISSLGGQYDTFRDSINMPYIRGKSFKFSFVSPSTSHHPMSGDSLVSHSLGTEHNVDKRTPSSNNRFLYSNKDHNTPGKGYFTTGKLTGESVIDGHNAVMLEEENASGTSCVRHSSNNNKNEAAQNTRYQVDGSMCKKDSKVVGSKIEMEVNRRTDGDIQKESKALRHFHAALVDFVKELLKPTWRKGCLSKDAHNAIVKKTVDKVIGTLLSHQVPSTMESINQYLSLSRLKITKLVEAYVTKYGKS